MEDILQANVVFLLSLMGFGGVYAVKSLVNYIKDLTNNSLGRGYLLIALGLSLIIQITGYWVFDMLDNKISIVAAIFMGIFVGLAASGHYDSNNNG